MQKRKIEPQKPANPCDTRLCSCIFFVNTLQKPSEIVGFRGLFLFFVYCGAEGEKRIFNVCQIENITEICYNIKKEV